MDSQTGYQAAMQEIEHRYGRQDVVANAFVKRALAWPIIKADNAKGLDEYAIFIAECNHAVKCVVAVRVLEYPDNLRKLVAKLPFYCHEKWRNIVQHCRIKGEEVKFQHLTDFVRGEATKATDPTFGREAMSLDQNSGLKSKRDQQAMARSRSVFTTAQSRTSIASNVNEKTGATNDSKGTGFSFDEITFYKSPSTNCEYCQTTSHDFYSCDNFKKMSIQNRINYLRSKGLCFSCFKRGHQKPECRNKVSCSVCQGRHPTSMHIDRKQREANVRQDSPSCQQGTYLKEHSNFSTGTSRWIGEGICTMAIVPVKVRMKDSLKTIETYAFLDPGSSISFCTEGLMHQLGAQGSKMKITLDTMANPYTMTTDVLKNLEIGDLTFSNPIALPRVYTKDRIPVDKTHIPTRQDISRWDHLHELYIPELDADIGLLIGNGIPDAYTPIDIRTGPRGSPHAVRTLLGWVVWNLVRETSSATSCYAFPVNRANVFEKLDEARKLESMVKDSINRDFPERITDEVSHPSQEDLRFLKKVDETMTLKNGHYQMRLPFKNVDTKVPNNYVQALQRLKGLRKQMEKNSSFHEDYITFINKIIDNEYAEKVPYPELDRNDGKVWYIPHHGVYHPRKPNKIRVVFDCAAQYTGISLNNMLLQGPNLTNSLLAMLLRFRQGHVAIMADIDSMFYQVRIPREDCDYLRFLWWPDGNFRSKPEVYRMVVHLFGAVSSPSCCNAALRRTAEDNLASFSKTVTDMITKSFYVDDCLKSVDSEDQAIEIIQQVTELCSKGGFRLCKWCSNNTNVLETVHPDERAKEIKTINLEKDALPDERALGVHWAVQTDVLGFSVLTRDCSSTRRGILSIASSVYDPLGFSSPFILQAKQILQDMCRRGLKWDQEITGTDLQNWKQWLRDLPCLEKISHPRCYKPAGFGDVHHCDLHIFSDASEKGYGVVAYLRLVNHYGIIHCSFVIAKSRVVPLKKVTIPRLELTAATVAAKFSLMLTREIEYTIQKVVFWTDSQAVLNYINSETGRFHTFVENRITVIREVSKPCQWNYVESKINPADAASRGQDMKCFLNNKSWFDGPQFLWNPESKWPTHNKRYEVSEDDPELRKVVSATSQKTSAMDVLINHYSSLWKLKRAIAWFLQLMSNLKDWVVVRRDITRDVNINESDTAKRQLLTEEKMKTLKLQWLNKVKKENTEPQLKLDILDLAKRSLIRHVQREYFHHEMTILENHDGKTSIKDLGKSKQLYKLDPFILNGILRVGGRLSRADIPLDAMHPILLPKNSSISKMILDEIHKESGHMGRSYVISKSRETYWILGASSLIKSILSKCVTCRKYYAKGGVQKMADIPSDRLASNEPPFSCTGVDYFGPFDVKRGRCTVKRYGVLFTCTTTRAVHLEVAFSLDTSSCINAIRRFMARRGNVKRIYSDNGTNLVGSQRELKEEIDRWNNAHISKHLQQHGIEWHFNPPTGSHFGGIWERMIRSVRKVLYGLLQKNNMTRLDDESLSTLFCEVEAILNARPLTEMPSCPRDLRVLTPNDLLLLHSGTTLPPGIFEENDCYVRRRWRHVQYLADIFWKRWILEYLPLLQLRQKWTQPHRNIAKDDLVLLVDNTPRSSWSMGRVLEVYPDKKGFVRMVKVKTRTNVLLRPIHKLCLIAEAEC